MSDSLSDEFLAQGSEWWQEQHEKVIKLKPEIDLIMDPKVRSLVIFLLSKADLFWHVAISNDSSPFYPDDEYELGGMVLHVRRTVQAFMLLESGFFSNDERDAGIAALLLRNITKPQWIEMADYPRYAYDPFHVYTVDAFTTTALATAQLDGQDLGLVIGIDGDIMTMIFRLIRTSCGPESIIPETIPATELERVVYYAELMASTLKSVLYGVDFEDDYDDEDDDDDED